MSNVNPALSTVRNLKGKLEGLQRDVFKAGDSFKSTEQEDEQTALLLLQRRLTELEFALVKMGGIERLGDAEKASIMAKIDSNRRDLLAAARECTPHVSSAGKDVVAAVVNFARLKDTTEVISPRDFGVEWKTPAKTEANRNGLKRLSIGSVTSSVRSEPYSSSTPIESESARTMTQRQMAVMELEKKERAIKEAEAARLKPLNDLKRLSIGSVTSSVRSEPHSSSLPIESEGTQTLTQRQMAVMELEKKERAIKEAEAARLKPVPVHNPGSQRAAALEDLNKAHQKIQSDSKPADGNKPTPPSSGTSQRAAAMKQLASTLIGPSPPPPPPSLAAQRAQLSQASAKAPKPPSNFFAHPLRKVDEGDSSAQSIFAESRRTTQESLCNLDSSRAPPSFPPPPSSVPQQQVATGHLSLAERMARANRAPIHAPADTSIDLQLPPPPPPSHPSYLSANDRYRSTGGSSSGGGAPLAPAPAPPVPLLAKTSMGGSSSSSHHHQRQQQLSAAMEAALPTLQSLRLADPQRRGSGGGSVTGPIAPQPTYNSRLQSLGGYVRQPAIIDQYCNLDEEEEEERRRANRRGGGGVWRKVLAGVGSVLTLALVTGGAVVAASLLNSGLEESSRHHSMGKKGTKASRVPRGETSSSTDPQAPPYLPNNVPFVFRG